MVLVYDATRFPTFLLLCQLSFLYELLQNGEGKHGNCTIQDPIARTNDFLFDNFLCFPCTLMVDTLLLTLFSSQESIILLQNFFVDVKDCRILC